MSIKNIIKETIINEVGGADKRPFRFKRDAGYDTPSELKKEKDGFDYVFKTKEDITYTVTISREMNRSIWGETPTEGEWKSELADFYANDRKKYISLKRMGVTRDDLRTMWLVSFSITDSPREDITYTGSTYYGGPSNVFTVSSRTYGGYDEPNKGDFFKIMSTVVKIIKNHIKKHGGRVLTFVPYDERRARIFSHFIMTQVPGSKMWVDHNEYYFLLNL